jgi:hypothetical protein
MRATPLRVAPVVKALVAAALTLVSFGPPHHVRVPAAKMTAALSRRIDAELSAAAPSSVDAALHVALDATARRLHFGLRHATNLSFDETEREGNCIEYAHLFAAIFENVAARAHLDAHAFVVHSDDARVLGERLAARGLDDHDWDIVVVHTAEGDRSLFVDPTLYDAGMDWDIEAAVRGTVPTP